MGQNRHIILKKQGSARIFRKGGFHLALGGQDRRLGRRPGASGPQRDAPPARRGAGRGVGAGQGGGLLLEGADVAQILAEGLGAQDAAHDLAAAGLRQALDEVDLLGPGDGPELVGHLLLELVLEGAGGRRSGLEQHEAVDGVALELVGQADGGGLRHGGMAHQGALDLGRAQAVSADLEDVVAPADDPEVAVLVHLGRVAGVVPALALEAFPVGLAEALGVVEDGAGHAGPGVLDDQVAFVPGLHLHAVVVHHGDLVAEEGPCGAAGLEGRDGQRADHEPAGLGLPPGVDDGAVASAHEAVVPLPGLGVDGLAHGAEQAQAREVVLLGPGLAEAHQAADGRRGGVKDVDAVLLDHLPPAVGVGVVGGSFVEEDGAAVDQGGVGDVAVAGDPSRVGGAPEAVFVLDVEGHAVGGGGIDLVPAVGVDQPLGLSGGAGGVEQEEHVLGVHDLGLAAGRGDGQGLEVVEPVVAVVLHEGFLSGAADGDADLDGGGVLEGLVDDLLELGGLAAAEASVGGEHDAALGVVDALGQGLVAESAIDDAVGGADLGAGEHGEDLLGHLGHVDGNDVALLDAHGLEDVGHLGDFAVEGVVGEGADVAGLAFPDDGQLVAGGGGQVPVDGVADDVGLRADEPLVEGLAAVVEDLVPALVPEELFGLLGPEVLPVLDGVLVELVVLLDVGCFDHYGRGSVDFGVFFHR